MSIQYVTGDATEPVHTPATIAHICNNFGAWDAGFVLAVSKKYPQAEAEYRKWHKMWFHEDALNTSFVLGNTQFVRGETGILIANMLAQKGGAVDYSSVGPALAHVARMARILGHSVHMPRIGCGIGGGSWDVIEPIVMETLFGLKVYVYDLSTGTRTSC